MGCAMYNIGICDDGENICASIEDMLMQCAKEINIQLDISVWYTGERLKDYLEKGNPLDILFLDIELFQMTGIEVGDYIRNQLDDMGMQIIYISGKASYARQLFKTQPLDFLVKPISQSQIRDVLDMALKVMKRKKEKFEFQQGKDYYYVPMGDIVYFGSQGSGRFLTTKRAKEQRRNEDEYGKKVRQGKDNENDPDIDYGGFACFDLCRLQCGAFC